MKVNTDGVLLGAAMTLEKGDKRLLDIGTGTGTIALMAAQRLTESFGLVGNDSVTIDAIDIDEPSATEAAMNFRQSPWAECLCAHNLSLDQFAEACSGTYDLIFSNPPYFENSLTAPNERKSTARHTSDGLSYRDIFTFACERLSTAGRVALVLPADQENDLCRHARMMGFHLFRIMRIRTVPRKDPTRMIVEFSRQRIFEPREELLTIQDAGNYTSEYLALTRDFYLFA
jgi:tRNA1Val (adenine37-N6)-methyltransferase